MQVVIEKKKKSLLSALVHLCLVYALLTESDPAPVWVPLSRSPLDGNIAVSVCYDSISHY